MTRPSVLMVVALLAAVATVAAAAQSTPAHSSSGSKILTGKICQKSGDAACVRCSKAKKSGHALTCLACSSGPVPAELNDAGRCVCPAGSALTGSSGSSGKKSKKSAPATCSACAIGFFAPLAKPVASSVCKKCPTGTTTASTGAVECGPTTCPLPNLECDGVCTDLTSDNLNCGSCNVGCYVGTTCAPVPSLGGQPACNVEAGSFFDGKKVSPCPVDKFCEGGPIGGAGNVATACPTGSTTKGATGSDEIGDCIVPPGSFFDGQNVVPCSVGFYCTGGPIFGAGDQTLCPPGNTSPPGSNNVGQCYATCAPAPNRVCDGVCTDVTTDRQNCGACGVVCVPEEECRENPNMGDKIMCVAPPQGPICRTPNPGC